jgi:TonB family protein
MSNFIMKIFLAVILLFVSICGIGQVVPPPPSSIAAGKNTTDSTSFILTETMPEFPGSFQDYLRKTVTYPVYEKSHDIQGTVYISFVVEKDGSISDVHPIKEVPCAPGFTREAVRVISQMPKWKPGKLNGHAVRIEMRQPIRFVLDGNNGGALCGKELFKEERIATCHCNPGKLPEFVGGEAALHDYISKSISLSGKNRKKWARIPISFSFIIDTSGQVYNVNVKLPGAGDEKVKNEIAGVLCGMPLWIPGSGDSVKLRVRMEGKLFVGDKNNPMEILFNPMDLIPFEGNKAFIPSKKFRAPEEKSIIQPSFAGGAIWYYDYVRPNLVYPEAEKKAGKEGTVVISFIVEMDGSITYIEVKSEVEGAPGFTTEAKRLVAEMPKWIPGKINGVVSRMPAEVKIDFKL